jgi:TetR/AcrR family acrAB operon transcriptional repressor
MYWSRIRGSAVHGAAARDRPRAVGVASRHTGERTSKKMARRTREEALVTREQLLDAAERVFRERGVGHTSLAEVADAAGVTRGAIYWHFRSKAELFKAMVERAEMPMDAALEQLADGALEDPLGQARDLAVRALLHLATSERTRAVFDVVFLRCEYTEDLLPVQQQHLRERQLCIEKCAAAFRLAVNRGQLPADTDTGLAARGLYAFVGGLMRDAVESPRDYDLAASAPPLIDLFFEGLRRNPPRKARRTTRPKKAA